MKKVLLLFGLTLLLIQGSRAQSTAAMHNSWDAVLQKHVSKEGRVDYDGIKGDPSFDRYIGMLQRIKGIDQYAPKDALSFWINVYNAFTIKLITDHYPIQSIKDIPNAFDEKFVSLRTGTYSLNQIENEIIRPLAKDARVHFLLNCVAISCPKLQNRAITDVNLDELMTQATKSFLSNSELNRISENKLELSEIFNWYATDFDNEGGVIAFVKKHSGVNVSKSAVVEYLPYNWALNSQKK